APMPEKERVGEHARPGGPGGAGCDLDKPITHRVALHFSDQLQLISQIGVRARVGGPRPTGRSALARPEDVLPVAAGIRSWLRSVTSAAGRSTRTGTGAGSRTARARGRIIRATGRGSCGPG